MNKRILGRTGIEVSEISFGGVEIGIPYGIGVETEDQMPKEDEALRLLLEAVDGDINFFDTARMYGRSENIMGRAFKNRRDDVVICTKCVHLQPYKKESASAKKLHEVINNSLKESLSALKTEYVDVYMVHDANLEMLDDEQIAEIFCECRKKGLAKAIGVSTYTTEETVKAIESGIWDVVQVPFNLMDQQQSRCFAAAQQHGVGIVIRSVLFRGVLTEKGRHLHPALKSVEEHCGRYNELLNKDVPTLSDLATKFVLSFEEISSVLIGIDRSEYLQKALAVADGKYLDQKTFARAKQLVYPDVEFLNIQKWDKMGWL